METIGRYVVEDQPETEINPAALFEYSTQGYVPPTDQDVRAAIRCCAHPDGRKYTGGDVGRLLGVDDRTVRRWCTPAEKGSAREMPYSSWRLLLICAGLVEPTRAARPAASGKYHGAA